MNWFRGSMIAGKERIEHLVYVGKCAKRRSQRKNINRALMREVTVRGFIPSTPTQKPSVDPDIGGSTVSVRVAVPQDSSSLDCNWLMDRVRESFQNAGVDLRLAGLLNTSKNSTLSQSVWTIEPSTPLESIGISGELEAVFTCDQLTVGGTSDKKPKLSASDFEFIRLLGEGATCKVFQVKRKKTGKVYAVKVLDKSRILGNHRKIEQALTERQVLVEVRHPFIVQLHWTFQTRSHLFFVLEFCPGGELFFHLSKRGRFDEEISRFYFSEVLLGLEYLHSKNIIYRDLKLENILLDVNGHVRLTDFGVSKLTQTESKNNELKSVVGTKEYFSPEMIKREGHGKPYDFYCLGCVLYIMLTGSLPYFQGNWTEMYQKRVIGGVLQFPRGVPRLAMDLCARLLDRDPNTRIGSVGGSEEVRRHPWLELVNWEELYSMHITPPIDPKRNLDNFDPQFTARELSPQIMMNINGSSGSGGGLTSVNENLPAWSFAEEAPGSSGTEK
jgi:serine/threonine protein kinase